MQDWLIPTEDVYWNCPGPGAVAVRWRAATLDSLYSAVTVAAWG